MSDAENPDDVEALYPEGSVTENRVSSVSALCSFGVRPRAVTGMIRQILVQHFCDPDNLEDAGLRARFKAGHGWRNDEHTGILIESNTRWRPELTEKRPAIIIKRNDWQWQRVTIGDQAGDDWRDGFMQFLGFWLGTSTLFALAQEGGEAETLGAEVSRVLLHCGALIVHELSLHRFVPVSVGAVHRVKEATQNYAVPVTFAYAAEEAWELQPLAPRLKRFVFRASEVLGQ